MSLQFYFGASGAGKSRKLHMDIIEWAEREPHTNFLILVPDQFTMQTQMDMIRTHPRHGIMNIDVLSFGRLSHRIWEEVGGKKQAVLDDTGKSLILRKVAANLQGSLPYIGGNLRKQGYIHEVKSSISEFMQYGIGADELTEILEDTKSKQVLHAKLKDLHTLYQGFHEYINDRYITTEETLERLREQLKQSKIIKNSVIALDGFTGFTPVQYRLLQELMRLSKRMIVVLSLGEGEDAFRLGGEQELFYLTKKTITDLCRLSEEIEVGREDDIHVIPGEHHRFAGNPEMSHLERGLFRYPLSAYHDIPECIRIVEASDIEEEVHQICLEIRRLVTAGKYAYRDIAIIAGDIDSYSRYVEREAKRYDIPVYVDRTRGIQLNPFSEYIRSALRIIIDNFSYEAVFHYMRSGFAGFTPEETDRLENYILSLGIRGKKRWNTIFTRPVKNLEEERQLEALEELNILRMRLTSQLAPLMGKMKTADEMIDSLYGFVVEADIQNRLAAYETLFRKSGNMVKEREYAQIYRLVMELFEQVHELLENEAMTLEEFADILDAGFLEIEVGSIPQNIDRVLVGDMERTRLKQVRVLFLIGANDGNIPRNSGAGGIISDLEREYLQGMDVELAPTPRRKIYIQRFYLYMNMTKPSDLLYVSFARMNAEGKTMRPAYLIDALGKLFPAITIEKPQFKPQWEQIGAKEDVMNLFLKKLRRFAEGISDTDEERELFSLYRGVEEQEQKKLHVLVERAFAVYENHPLKKEIAKLLYGNVIMGSASRLERYAACAYAHFLKYGLTLREREEYQLEQVDLGNIYHGVLELFSDRLEASPYTWFDFPQQEGEEMLRAALEEYSVTYGETIFYSNARNMYMIERMQRILKRSVFTIQKQIKQGVFAPKHFEVSFQKTDKLSAVNIALSDTERLKLTGRIDRVDTYEDENHVYVKVIDYKSGNQKFDLAALYYGLQLQLVIYMNAAMEMEKNELQDAKASQKKEHSAEKEIVPAALLYYHVDDPMIKSDRELSPEEVNRQLLQELCTSGVVNEKEGVVSLLDKDFTDKSFAIPVQRKKDGSYSTRSSLLKEEEFGLLSSYVNYKMKQFGKEILEGNIEINPYEQGNKTACTYCSYQSVCGFDEDMEGFEKRQLKAMDNEEVFEEIRRADIGGDIKGSMGEDTERNIGEDAERNIGEDTGGNIGGEAEIWQ